MSEARYAKLISSYWQDKEVKKLSFHARHAYPFLFSQGDLDHCGVLPLLLEVLAEDYGIEADEFKAALKELEAARYIVVDWRRQKILVRTYLRHDGMTVQPNMMKAARRRFADLLRHDEGPITDGLIAEYPSFFGPIGTPPDGDSKPSQVVAEPLPEGFPEGFDEPVADEFEEGLANPEFRIPSSEFRIPSSVNSPPTTLSSQSAKPAGGSSIQKTKPDADPRRSAVLDEYAKALVNANPKGIANLEAVTAKHRKTAGQHPKLALWLVKFPHAKPADIARSMLPDGLADNRQMCQSGEAPIDDWEHLDPARTTVAALRRSEHEIGQCGTTGPTGTKRLGDAQITANHATVTLSAVAS